MKIKILLVDDCTAVSEELTFFLGMQENLEVVRKEINEKEGLVIVGKLQPDIILMDLHIPNTDGIKTIVSIKRKYPHVKVLVLTNFFNQEYVLLALKAGVSGYILKTVKPSQLVAAIRSAYQGNIQLSSDVFKMLLSQTLPQEEETQIHHPPCRGGSSVTKFKK
ncbi:response regulator [Bacillus cereus]